MEHKEAVKLIVKRMRKVKEPELLFADNEFKEAYCQILACVTGVVDEKNQLIIEYLLEEVRYLRKKIDNQRLSFDDSDRVILAEKGRALGRKLLKAYATVATPDTILKWYRKLVAKSHTYSNTEKKKRGRPPTDREVELMIVQFAKENAGWGYDRIVGTLENLLQAVSRQTIGNILKKHGVEPSPERKKKTAWKRFIKSHLHVMWATDFFTTEYLTPFGAITVYVLFFIHLETRRVVLGGITTKPNKVWMKSIARDASGFDGALLSNQNVLAVCSTIIIANPPETDEPQRLKEH